MDQDRLSALLSAGCDEFLVPGAQIGLLRGDERVVVCAGTTDDDGNDPVSRGTRFHAGSLAKSVTSLVVMAAARRGDLDLDAPSDEQAAGLWPDTPRSLMAQTTGRPNLLPDAEEDLETFVERVGAMPLVHPPGRFSYSNANWSALDLLLRRRCGASFEELAAAAFPDIRFGMPDGSAHGHAASAGRPLAVVQSDAAAAASAAGSRWWATADELLDHARVHLRDGVGRFDAEDVREQRRPQATVPGATISDAWGLGWALWSRGDHEAFGWAGYTAGHRAYLRCFPRQDAAMVVLTNSAGPLFGPPGGNALFDTLLPQLLTMMDVPPLGDPVYGDEARPVGELAGGYGPLVVEQVGSDSFLFHAAAFGEPEPLLHERIGGNTFVRQGRPPGGMALAFDENLLYIGPFAVPRND